MIHKSVCFGQLGGQPLEYVKREIFAFLQIVDGVGLSNENARREAEG
jgi:hypothetical protein